MVIVNNEKLEGIVARIRDNYIGDLRFKGFRVFWHNLQLSRREPEIENHTQRNLSAIETYHASSSVMQGLKALGNRWFKDYPDIPPGHSGTVSYIEKHHPDIDKPDYRIDLTEHTLAHSRIERFGLEVNVIVNGIPRKHQQDGKNSHMTCGPFVFYYLIGDEPTQEDFDDGILTHELAHAKSYYHVDKGLFYEEVWAQLAAGGNVRDIVEWIDLANPKFQNRDVTRDLAKAIVLEEMYKALKANQRMDRVDNGLLMCKNLNEALFELYVVNNYEKSQKIESLL